MPNELILIVEDNPKNLKLVRDTLQVQGYQTIEAETGEEGMQLARERRPALILMDIQLPAMNGIEALGELRADPTTRAIRLSPSPPRSWLRTVGRSWRRASMASRASRSACGSSWRQCVGSWRNLNADVHGAGGRDAAYTYARLYNLYLDPKETHGYLTSDHRGVAARLQQ